jgi:hypothetical protein
MSAKSRVNLAAFRRLHARVKAAAAAKTKLKIGVLTGSGTEPGSEITLVELAAIHEFGSPAAGIPERSFLRKTFQLQREEIKAMTEKLAKRFLEDKIELNDALGLLGQWLVARVRETITNQLVTPRLSESEAGRRTIKRKGSSVTLIDTGHLINAISYEIKGA